MAEDVVILLSSDESDAFVTPHKPIYNPPSRRHDDVDDDDDDDDDNGIDGADFPGQRLQSRIYTGAAAGVAQTAGRTETWRAVDGSPTRPSGACPGSTPYSTAVARPSGSRGAADVLLIDDTPIPISSTSTIAPPSRASRVFPDSFDDEDDLGMEQSRPSKRPRLSPRTESRAFPTAAAGSPRLNVARHIAPALPSHAQPPRTRTTFTMDDSDDEVQGITRPAPVLAVSRETEKIQAPASHAECIDLLSSSDSETGHPPPPKKAADASEPEFVDIDDLLNSPALPKKVLASASAPAPAPALRQTREPSAEIMLLSSSPLTRPSITASAMTRKTSLPGRVSTRPAPKPQARKAMKRSFSEGHALAFDDDDDDDFAVWGGGLSGDFRASQGVDDLLAAWRTDTPSHLPSHAQPARPQSSGRGDIRSPSGRRTSFGTADGRTAAAAGMTDAEKDARRREREALREAKRRDKEAEKERRQRDKEVEKERRKINADMAREKKARERAEAAAFNDANRSRVDKAVAAPEMIVRLPMALPQATKEITEGLLCEIKSRSEMWNSPLQDNVVTWRRRVTAEYEPDLGHWVPVKERIEDEKHAMAIFRADDLVKLILAAQDPEIKHQAGGYDLEGHLRAMKRIFPRHTLIYLVEGLHAWRSKNRSIRNRQFVEAVRNPAGAAAAAALSRAGQPDGPAADRPSDRLGRRGQKKSPQYLDDAVVDDAILELQMGFDDDDDDDDDDDNGDDDNGGARSRIMVHETLNSLDTARWIKIFTEQIATGRYRRLKEEMYAASASFCMDSGQIATGDGGPETYALMLQQIARVTEPVALGVAARHNSWPKLVRGFRDEGPLALEGCLKSRNRNGALSDRTVGQALSRRIYKVAMGHDEASTDV